MNISKEKIYGAFTYLNAKDKLERNWSMKQVESTLLKINKKANQLLETRKYSSIEIMVYNPKKMKWELISSKSRMNLKD
jgi:hypothetical protein